jgi:gamma-butyrobetaine dioxygenase
MSFVDAIFEAFRKNGDALYDGGEAVTQSQHALQAATLAERDGHPAALVAAALLHDYGHVAGRGDRDLVDRSIDGRHEEVGARILSRHFIPAVVEPGRLHVAAKRYLCAVDPGYFASLSPVSVRSLELQGGPFTPAEAKAFEARPHFAEAVQLRRYDERAKDPAMETPGFEHFRPHLEAGLIA